MLKVFHVFFSAILWFNFKTFNLESIASIVSDKRSIIRSNLIGFLILSGFCGPTVQNNTIRLLFFTRGVNFTNILLVALAPVGLC